MPISRVTSSVRSPELLALGERLADSRRHQGISQEELAERLRLGTDQLDALEQGDLSRLPEPVFVIAQAKRVASALGVNIDAQISALRRSGLMTPQRRSAPIPPPWVQVRPRPQDEAASAAQDAPEPDPAPAREMAWLPAATAAVLILSVSAVLLFTQRGGDTPGERRLSPPVAAPARPPAPRP